MMKDSCQRAFFEKWGEKKSKKGIPFLVLNITSRLKSLDCHFNLSMQVLESELGVVLCKTVY